VGRKGEGKEEWKEGNRKGKEIKLYPSTDEHRKNELDTEKTTSRKYILKCT
jgi:hypothetical protein